MRRKGAQGAAERQGSWEQLWEENDKIELSLAWENPTGIRSLLGCSLWGHRVRHD